MSRKLTLHGFGQELLGPGGRDAEASIMEFVGSLCAPENLCLQNQKGALEDGNAHVDRGEAQQRTFFLNVFPSDQSQVLRNTPIAVRLLFDLVDRIYPLNAMITPTSCWSPAIQFLFRFFACFSGSFHLTR